MPRTRLAFALVVTAALLALVAPANLAWDWARLARVAPEMLAEARPSAYDWVHWDARDGQVVAAYVFPRGPAAHAGLQPGDTLVSVQGALLSNADAVATTIAALPVGERAVVEMRQHGRVATRTVVLSRSPTFLFPRSAALWSFALWGFVLAAFGHAVALGIAVPLARTVPDARPVRRLILVSALWIGSTLLRLWMLEVLGPPRSPGGVYDLTMQGLTVVGLVGWIVFPTLLVLNVLRRTRLSARPGMHRLRGLTWLPAVGLGGAALVATVRGGVGPFPLDALVAPILLYAGLYVALAALLPFVVGGRGTARLPGGFARLGTFLTAVSALVVLGALVAAGPGGRVGPEGRAWLVVGAQLLSVAPVLLVAQATLRFGHLDAVFSRAFGLLVAGGVFFFLLTAVLYGLRTLLVSWEPSWPLVAGIVASGLFLAVVAGMQRVRARPPAWLVTERQRARARIAAFQEAVPLVLDADDLARQALALACESVAASSAVLFYRRAGDPEWRTASYHPHPPYLTAAMAARLWPHLRSDGRVWTRRAELRETSLPPEHVRLLDSVGADLALPVMGEEGALGMLMLSAKRNRRAVYNLDDLDLLRLVCGALALGLERLDRIEREKALAKARTEAQLVALRAQINPHFLFNALNTIAALIAERPDDAEQAVEHLARIFRHTLTTAEAPTVPLGTELGLVERYLAIEQMRFGERMQVSVSLPDDLATVPVPAFAVQTLVENAVKHGLEPRRGPVALGIAATRDGADVLVSVSDSGVGVRGMDATGTAPPSVYGVGLSNVAARLRDLYGRDDLLAIASAPGEGTTATLRLPG